MNNEENKIFYEMLSVQGKEAYDNYIKGIKRDFSNMSYLLKYLTNYEDNNVIDAIINYLKDNYDVDMNNEKINFEFLPNLIREHTNNYNNNLVDFHELINFGDSCIENAVIFDDEDAIDRFIDNLKELRFVVNEFSNFILNYCAIIFIVRETSPEKLQKINKKYEIDYKYQHFNEILSVNSEFTIAFQKLKRFILQCYCEEYNEEIKVSLYDAKMLTELIVPDVLNKFSKELAIWIGNCGGKYDLYNFVINSICFYCVIWSVAMNKSEYGISMDYYIKEFYVHLIEPLKDLVKDNSKNYYSDLVNGFDNWKKQIDLNEELFSEKNLKSLHKYLENTICKFDYKTFKCFYAETLSEINKLIN